MPDPMLSRTSTATPSAATPGRRQFRILLSLASGAAGLSRRRVDIDPLLARHWVTADWRPPYYQMVRITPEGLRAAAAGVERYGLPDLQGAAVTRRVCADCGSERIRYFTEGVDHAAA